MALSSLSQNDRRLLWGCLIGIILVALLIGIVGHQQVDQDNPTPSSYRTTRYGARAAYDLLSQSGYKVERWESSLKDLVPRTNGHTVVILTEPFFRKSEDRKTVKALLEHGAKLIVTGVSGGMLLPENAATYSGQMKNTLCELTPEGFEPVSLSGTVWMRPESAWQLSSPKYRVQYSCAGAPAVVEYEYGNGHIIWWASASPLQNYAVARDGNLNLLLNSIGHDPEAQIYWDESMHRDAIEDGMWSKASGRALQLLVWGLVGLAVLLIFSFSRRSGPMREMPLPQRATPVEFVEALGSLYSKSEASSTAVSVAYDRFRLRVSDLCGQNAMQMSSAEVAEMISRRFPAASPGLAADLKGCADAVDDEFLEPKRALVLIQALDGHASVIEALLRDRAYGNGNS